MLTDFQLLRLATVFTAMAHTFLGFLLTHDGVTAENWPQVAWLTLRLILTEVRDEAGQMLARWYLMTNVFDSNVSADLFAL